MALKDVLSGIRCLILNPEEFPEDPAGRKDRLLKQLPALTEEEVLDLVKLDRARLNIYTTSIFTGEGELLEKFMPKSFEHTKKNWGAVSTEQFSKFRLAKLLASVAPWNSFSTLDLLMNFHNFFKATCALPRFLVDLSLFESSVYKVRKSPATVLTPLTRNDCYTRTVEELLNTRFSPSDSSAWLSLDFDILGDLSERASGVLISRDAACKVSSRSISSALAQFCSKNREFSAEEISELLVTSDDPMVAINQLIDELLKLNACGALLLASSESARGFRADQR